jgi:Domain of unknown function (DUF222)
MLERMFGSEEIAGIGPELAGLLAALRLAELDEDALIAAVAAADRLVSWANAAQLTLIGELARRRNDPEFVEDEIAAELRLSRPAAAHRLALALDLDRLPAVTTGLAAGRLDLPKAKAITEAIQTLSRPTAADLAGQAIPHAAEHTVGQLRAWLRRAVLAADPAAAQTRHELAVAERRVTLTPQPDGMAELWALLPADDAARAYTALDTCARDSTTPHDPRSADARRADALIDLLAGQRTAPPTTIHVTVPLATLIAAHSNITTPGTPTTGASAPTTGAPTTGAPTTGASTAGRAGPAGAGPTSSGKVGEIVGEQPGQIPGIGPIPAAMARRLAADGVWRWLATSPDGTITAAGTRAYRPPPALATLIRGRDQTCRFPGCRQPAHRCDLDHTTRHPHGATTPDNLAALCRHHHRLKHQTDWTVRQHPDGRLTWTSPTGRTYTTHPAHAA